MHSSEAMDGLGAAIDAVADLDLPGLGPDLLAVTRDLLTARNRIDALLVHAVHGIDTGDLAPVEGSPSAAAWLRGHGRLHPHTAGTLSSVGRRIGELPELGKAFAAGEVSLDHVRAVTGLLRDLPADTVRLAEPALVDLARTEGPHTVARAAARVREAAFPDGTEAQRRRLHEGRHLGWGTTLGGALSLSGLLDPEAAALFQAAIGPFLRRGGTEDTRTSGQRRHDAFADLCRSALAADTLPDTGGDRPRVMVHVDYDTLLRAAGGMGADPPRAHDTTTAHRDARQTTQPNTTQASTTQTSTTQTATTRTPGAAHRQRHPPGARLGAHGLAETTDGTPIATSTLLRLACDAVIGRIVFGPDGHVLDLGHTARFPTAAQRRALVARDRGCVFPHCDQPARRCHAHHRRHWLAGGPTDLTNLALLCPFHHTLVHDGGWTLTHHPDGSWTAQSPRGLVLHRPPPRRRE